MNFSGIKHKVLSKKIERSIKSNNKNSLQVDRVIKSVGIIVKENSKFNFESLKKLQKEIPIGSKNFSVLTYKSKNETYNEFRGTFFYEKLVSLSGKIKSKEVKEFLNKEFDMLIDYTGAQTIFAEYLIVSSKAKFKVGYLIENKKLYNFMIDVPFDNTTKFNNELIKYLKILNKL
jgi:hypothetical protein